MSRCMILEAFLIAALGSVGAGHGQDTGRPIDTRLPGQVAYAYLYNNVGEPIRCVVCSSVGAISVVLAPGEYARFPFRMNGASRMLNTFAIRSGSIRSVRELILSPDYLYLAGDGPMGVEPLSAGIAAPGSSTRAPIPTPARPKSRPKTAVDKPAAKGPDHGKKFDSNTVRNIKDAETSDNP